MITITLEKEVETIQDAVTFCKRRREKLKPDIFPALKPVLKFTETKNRRRMTENELP